MITPDQQTLFHIMLDAITDSDLNESQQITALRELIISLLAYITGDK